MDNHAETQNAQDLVQREKIACMLNGNSIAIDMWVRDVEAKSGVKLEWRHDNPYAIVFHEGGDTNRKAVLTAITRLKDTFQGTIVGVNG